MRDIDMPEPKHEPAAPVTGRFNTAQADALTGTVTIWGRHAIVQEVGVENGCPYAVLKVCKEKCAASVRSDAKCDGKEQFAFRVGVPIDWARKLGKRLYLGVGIDAKLEFHHDGLATGELLGFGP